MTINKNVLSLLCLLCIVITISCQKDEVSDNPEHQLSFSADTLLFDTVFTTIGSTTKILKIYNNNNERLSISSIKLAGSNQSNFSININGEATTEKKNILLESKDSLYIFVRVTVDPNQQNNPLIITDSIVMECNNQLYDIDLVAWGQDAHFIVANKQIGSIKYSLVAETNESVTWTNDKPYVIYGWAVVDSLAKLTIEKGCRIHFSPNSGLWVYKNGTLHVNGQKDSVVTFQGSRLEYAYQDIAGQWDRIWLNEGSIDNIISYAVIKNGFIGLQVETIDEFQGNKLRLENTIIKNMGAWGIFGKSSVISAYNCVISDCGQIAVHLSAGGLYEFFHCTIGNYWDKSTRKTPSIVVLDYYTNNATGETIYGPLEQAYFGNCIIYGNNQEELAFSQKYTDVFNYTFKNCLLKTELQLNDTAHFIDCIKNTDPLFKDASNTDFSLLENAPAINKGDISIGNLFPFDIQKKRRNLTTIPDIGAYEGF